MLSQASGRFTLQALPLPTAIGLRALRRPPSMPRAFGMRAFWAKNEEGRSLITGIRCTELSLLEKEEPVGSGPRRSENSSLRHGCSPEHIRRDSTVESSDEASGNMNASRVFGSRLRTAESLGREVVPTPPWSRARRMPGKNRQVRNSVYMASWLCPLNRASDSA